MSADSVSKKRVEVGPWTWAMLIFGLSRRGGGHRESGAFLLGRWTGDVGQVTRVVYYDDLDPRAYQGGIITFHGEGLAALWKICRDSGLEVVADCHTHGGVGTGQSTIDQRNPMIPESGHLALIFPYFGRMPPWSTRGVGVHEYLGNYRWRRHDQNGLSDRLSIRFFRR